MISARTLRVAVCAPLLIASSAFGYIRLTYTDASGTFMYSRTDAAGIQFYVNDQIKAGLMSTASGAPVTVLATNSDPVSAIRLALAQWNSIAGGSIKFLPLQTTSAVHDSGDNKAVITLASAEDLSAMGYVPGKAIGAVGLTVSTFAAQGGQLPNGVMVNRGDIIDSDILLNSSVTFSTDGSTPFDLQAVVTHELGHALGANHNGLFGSAMFPYATTGTIPNLNQRLLSSDDQSFLLAAYPQGASAFGTLSGNVVAADGSAVKAALLTLIDTAGGNSIGAITGSDGTYSVQIPPASYIIYAEPMTSTSIVQSGNIISLDPTQVTSNFQPAILGGVASPTAVAVPSGGTATAPTLTVAPGLGSLAGLPLVGFGAAGGVRDITSVMGVNGPRALASGQSVDIAFLGSGMDGTENIRILGQGISIRTGSVHVDKSVDFGKAGPLVRATLDVPTRQTATLASVFISKPSGTEAISGYLVVVPPQPSFVAAGFVSAASAQWLGAVSPGGLTAIYGVPHTSNLGPATAVVNGGYDAYGKLPGSLAGVTVTFDGIPAPLIFVAGGQINLQVPFEVAGKASTQVVVGYQGSFSNPVTVPVVSAQPAFFMLNATDPFAANADFGANPVPNSAKNPAARGGVISIYGTGFGKVSYDVPTGVGAPGPSAEYKETYKCALGSQSIAVPFAGWTPTSVGLAQWSFVIPANAATGAVSLKCTDTVSGAATQSATIYIK